MKAARMLLYGLLLLVVVVVLGAQFGLLSGRQPSDLGVNAGRLKPPSPTANSVSSQAGLYPDHPQRAYASIEPMPLKNGNAAASMQALAAVLRSLPGTTVVEQRPDYLYAHSQTRLLKFTDDLEFWHNPAAGVLELRSASRLGRGDLGVNRRRIETIRQAYLAHP